VRAECRSCDRGSVGAPVGSSCCGISDIEYTASLAGMRAGLSRMGSMLFAASGLNTTARIVRLEMATH